MRSPGPAGSSSRKRPGTGSAPSRWSSACSRCRRDASRSFSSWAKLLSILSTVCDDLELQDVVSAAISDLLRRRAPSPGGLEPTRGVRPLARRAVRRRRTRVSRNLSGTAAAARRGTAWMRVIPRRGLAALRRAGPLSPSSVGGHAGNRHRRQYRDLQHRRRRAPEDSAPLDGFESASSWCGRPYRGPAAPVASR